ncbi:hypothetical protein [Solicola sp. PLA-1-18]|uniref:hypothetical protein n=1 Tax=Solicola sp. PLA-1-18 TaxID=3380532 RepID=UPI003B7B9B46
MPDDLLLPAGHRLLHIGPPKTATTAVQSGFHHNRDAVSAQGVHYAGSGRQPMSAAMAVASGRSVAGFGDHRQHQRWPRLLTEIEESGADRVVVSSEFFADADDAAVARIVDDLGPDRTHVVVTLRPLARILPSQWQQLVQDRLRTSYDEWLHQLLDDPPPDDPPHGFWRRHRHDLLVRRWAHVVGERNVTVVVADDGDRDRPLHVFEDLVGLTRGTLRPSPDESNRSLTLGETALARAVNVEVAELDEVDRAVYNRLFRFGMSRHAKGRRPATDEQKVATPAWAVARAQEIGGAAADALATTGVRVVGDLDVLRQGAEAVGAVDEPATVPVEVAARAAVGVALGAVKDAEREERAAARRSAREAARARPPLGLRDATVRQILGELRRRLVRRP